MDKKCSGFPNTAEKNKRLYTVFCLYKMTNWADELFAKTFVEIII